MINLCLIIFIGAEAYQLDSMGPDKSKSPAKKPKTVRHWLSLPLSGSRYGN